MRSSRIGPSGGHPLRVGVLAAALAGSQLLVGTGAQAHTVLAPVPFPGGLPTALVVSNFGGGSGGCKDMAVADNATNTVRIFLGTGGCTGSFTEVANYSVGLNPTSIAVGQLDADLIPDLAVSASDSDQIWILYGSSGGTFTPRSAGPIQLPAGSQPRHVVAGNWGGGARDELAVANGGNDDVMTFDDSANNFAPLQTFHVPSVGGAQLNGLAVGNFNGDSDPDLAVSAYTAGTVSMLLGGVPKTFTLAGTYAAGPYPVSIIAASFDSDNDTLTDVVVANREASAPTVSFLKGNGDGTLQARVPSAVAAGYLPTAAAAGQLGGGSVALDLGVVRRDVNFAGSVQTLFGTGTGTFTQSHVNTVGYNANTIAVAQIIAGGAPDFAVGNSNSTISVLQG